MTPRQPTRYDQHESVSGPHWTRRKAQTVERDLTKLLPPGIRQRQAWLKSEGLPSWTRGFRVVKVGRLGRVWQVEATSWEGH